jgi:hypothetical protein
VHARSIGCVILLAGAVAVNVVQFPGIERMPNPRYHAIERMHTSDMFQIAYEDLYWAHDRFGLSLALSQVAPNARVLVPTPGPYDVDDGLIPNTLIWLRFARNGPTVVRVHYPGGSAVLTAAGIDPLRYVVASSRGSSKGAPWVLAAAPTWQGARREFVLLRWDSTWPGTRYAYEDVLIETSLLPDRIRQGLEGKQ